MELFDQYRDQVIATEAPLAARMRPRSLAEFVGQSAILGEGRLLRRAIQADQLSSLIFYGPPGTGKTTLAQIIANTTKAHFIAINAVLAGVQAIREAIATAQEKRGLYNQRTILFVDEVHRFNKSQQDALLPWVENGTVILIGATTENPYFEVNKALVSRSRIFQLKTLTASDLKQIVQQAIADSERGYGDRNLQLDKAALEHLVNIANGDARTVLNALELAVLTTRPNDQDIIHITLAVAEESIQRRAVLYDKEGDAHFDTISAFIKSLRGSDADAALYWLARMVYAGEDPRFIFRRMLIFAGEDVGLADPQAVGVVNACAQAFDRIGLPEGRYPLAQAALYLATAAKSNSVMGFFDALALVEKERESEVPLHLRDASRDQEGFGHGAGYLYPHAYRDHWVAQQYLPTSLQGQVLYQPSTQGYEAGIAETVVRQREAQLAALVEGMGVEMPEILSMGPVDSKVDRWLQRTLSQTGKRLAEIRDRLFTLAAPQRHHVILDLNAGSGLLTWEAVRQVPEGGVYAWVHQPQDFAALSEQILALPELLRPNLIQASAECRFEDLLQKLPSDLTCDRILARNLFSTYDLLSTDNRQFYQALQTLLSQEGQFIFVETVPQATQRLYRLLKPETLPKKLYASLQKAEEAYYQTNTAQFFSAAMVETWLTTLPWTLQLETQQSHSEHYLSSALCDRWFANQSAYIQHLRQTLKDKDVEQIRQQFIRQLHNQTVAWENTVIYGVISPIAPNAK
ncbi:MAG: AAA family ATPase [Synechococcales bacterium]|nr:AAA family ATPase [Synechococcales bacterium]